MRPHIAAATAMFALALGATAIALGSPQTATPAPQTSASAPDASPSPAPVAPTPSPTPAYRFIYRATPSPVTTPFPGPNAPEIDEIDLSDSVLVPPQNIYGRVLTNPAVVSVSAQTMGATLDIPKSAPGVFMLAASIPDVPQFLRNRSFEVAFTATTSDGRVATVTLELVIK